MRADDRIGPSSAPGCRRACQVLAGRIEAAASQMPYALSARWRIFAILRGVCGCKVSDLDEAQAADAIEIIDLVDQRVAWYLEQRRDVPEDQMRWIGARDVAVLLPTDAGRDYAQLAVMPTLPPLRTPRRSACVDGTDDIRLFDRARPVATIINLAERRRPHGRPSLTIVKGST